MQKLQNGKELDIQWPITLKDRYGHRCYREYEDGKWYAWVRDEEGRHLYFEDSDGYWYTREFVDGDCVYRLNSYGHCMDTRKTDLEKQIKGDERMYMNLTWVTIAVVLYFVFVR